MVKIHLFFTYSLSFKTIIIPLKSAFLTASKTAQIAKEYGVEQAALIGYGHVTEALDQGRR